MSRLATPRTIGPATAVPLGEARVFSVDGREIAVFRSRSGDVFAADATCPHRGGPLADGLVGGSFVICPLHGYAFDLRTGEAPGRECERLATYRAAVNPDGDIAVELP
jgi:nitrite reductase (NADH) small subunit